MVLWWSVGLSLAAGFILAAGGTALVRRLAPRYGFVDRPGGHKGHTAPVALGGGMAITAGLLVPIVGGFAGLALVCAGGRMPAWLPDALRAHVPGLQAKTAPALAIAAGALVLHAVGIVDDLRQLGPWIKLLIQVCVAVGLVVLFDIRMLTVLGPASSCAVTVLWIVGITNAFNFLDNMDGLCAGVAAITASIFSIAAMRAGQIFVPALACLVAGAALGFLVHNFPPARVFMGDAGSLVIGYFMAVLTVLTTFWDSGEQRSPFGLLIPVVVLAVPLYDTTSVVILRLRQGISPFRGDQRHFSHRLVRRGMSPTSAVLAIYLATAATGLGAALLPGASWWLAAVVVLQCACVVLIIAILEQVGGSD